MVLISSGDGKSELSTRVTEVATGMKRSRKILIKYISAHSFRTYSNIPHMSSCFTHRPRNIYGYNSGYVSFKRKKKKNRYLPVVQSVITFVSAELAAGSPREPAGKRQKK